MNFRPSHFAQAVLIAGVIAAPFGVVARTVVTGAKPDPARIVRQVMETPENQIDFAKAKLTFDALYDPSTDVGGSLKQVDAMAETIRKMAGPSAPSRLRLIMLRKYIYEAGVWNSHKPFQYDLTDPYGHKPKNRLLSTYLNTHRGNCVSMPVLFVALAQRLGLQATLSTAPNHIFVKYSDDVTGKTVNLETTSGAYPERDAWIRQNMPMTDEAIANGIYLKTLSKKEALAVMASIVLEGEIKDKRFNEALKLADVLRPYYPNNLAVLLIPADASIGLFHEEILSRYPTKADIPPNMMARYNALETTVESALNHAYSLGWRETDGEEAPSTAPTAKNFR